MNEAIVIDEEKRLVIVPLTSSEDLELRVPPLFGAIESAELRGAFVLVRTAGGHVSFHADNPSHVNNAVWREAHPVRGKMHWHSMKKALRTHCLIPEFSRRVDLHITHYRFKSGGNSSRSSRGWITLDRETLYRCPSGVDDAHGKPYQLGAALAEYLFLAPETAVVSNNLVVASLALLDRRYPDVLFNEVPIDRFSDALWCAFHRLRSSLG
jgi:hypothetical protein